MLPLSAALNRFGLGARPGDEPPGDPPRWLLDQFQVYDPSPGAWTAQPATADALLAYQALQQDIRAAADADKAALQQSLGRQAQGRYADAANMRLICALTTSTPFAERLVHFWSNHFAVSAEGGVEQALVGAFEKDAIRPHVLGRFEDMLLAVERHPAMLFFLDQSSSVGPGSRVAQQAAAKGGGARRPGLNENLAREAMELHTLGVRSGYTQADVTELARALTGWRTAALKPDAPAADVFQFQPAAHEPGARAVLGRAYAAGGEEQGLAILHDLSSAPATARHVAFKLARHFVADDPPPAVVERLALVFMRGRGDLPAVYRALVESPEAWSGGAGKFKSPWEWTVSSMRALGWQAPPKGMEAAPLLQRLGQPVWRPGSPAGYDDVAATWAAPDALMHRVETAQRFAGLAGGEADPRELAAQVLPGGALSPATAQAIARAESPDVGLALLLASPDFLRR